MAEVLVDSDDDALLRSIHEGAVLVVCKVECTYPSCSNLRKSVPRTIVGWRSKQHRLFDERRRHDANPVIEAAPYSADRFLLCSCRGKCSESKTCTCVRLAE